MLHTVPSNMSHWRSFLLHIAISGLFAPSLGTTSRCRGMFHSTFTSLVFFIIIIIIIIIIIKFQQNVLAVVIAVFSSLRRVITNDQRLTELSLLHISNTFLNILAVPNKAVFCITPTLNGIPSFPTHLSNPLVTLPRAPITTGTTSTILSFHSLPLSLFKSWYFSTFSLSFSPLLHQQVQQYR